MNKVNQLWQDEQEARACADIDIYLDGVWHDYDWRDNSTWPKGLDKTYLTRNGFGQYHVISGFDFKRNESVVSYLDIADIIPNRNIKDDLLFAPQTRQERLNQLTKERDELLKGDE